MNIIIYTLQDQLDIETLQDLDFNVIYDGGFCCYVWTADISLYTFSELDQLEDELQPLYNVEYNRNLKAFTIDLTAR